MSGKSKILVVVGVAICACVALGVRNYIYAHQTSAAYSQCEYNLLVIDICKENWKVDHDKPADYVLTLDDLREEFRPYAERYGWTNGVPICPDGGIYTVGRIGERPRCSIVGRGHSRP
jgi:hypothetical protein